LYSFIFQIHSKCRGYKLPENKKAKFSSFPSVDQE
jgi:hypothetical protein